MLFSGLQELSLNDCCHGRDLCRMHVLPEMDACSKLDMLFTPSSSLYRPLHSVGLCIGTDTKTIHIVYWSDKYVSIPRLVGVSI